MRAMNLSPQFKNLEYAAFAAYSIARMAGSYRWFHNNAL